MWRTLLAASAPHRSIWDAWLRDFFLEVTEALLGSAVGAILGAWLAWHFAKRLFQDQTRADEEAGRKNREMERRLAEASVVEEWRKKMVLDYRAFRSIKLFLEAATDGEPKLPQKRWPIPQRATSFAAPVLIGPLTTPCEEASTCLWALRRTIDENVRAHRSGGSGDLAKAQIADFEFEKAWDALDGILYSELKTLVLGKD